MSVNGQHNDRGRDQISPEDRDAFRRRASELGSRLDDARGRRAPEVSREARGQAFGQAFRIIAELVVGVAAGGVIGWAFDRWFSTAPWLLALGLLLGFAAGLLNVFRAARQMQAEAEALQRAAPSVADDDEK